MSRDTGRVSSTGNSRLSHLLPNVSFGLRGRTPNHPSPPLSSPHVGIRGSSIPPIEYCFHCALPFLDITRISVTPLVREESPLKTTWLTYVVKGNDNRKTTGGRPNEKFRPKHFDIR